MVGGAPGAPTQEPAAKPSEKNSSHAPAEKEQATKPELPFQIQLLETHMRFEANGNSRKEVHTIVKIINILGARQFARISFDYNRFFQQVEIPLVRISHANGGTSEVLPSAVTDVVNPMVEKFPAYQDVRVKSVRILGLQEGDTLEYRVITTTTHPALAPNFWLEHTFDRSGQVLHEIYELNLPIAHLRIRINPEIPALTSEKSGEGESARALYRWDIDTNTFKNAQPHDSTKEDVVLTTFSSWGALSKRLSQIILPGMSTSLWYDIMKAAGAPKEPVPPDVIYKYVSQKIATVDLPVDLSSSVRRTSAGILASGYGTSLEKAWLLGDAMSQNRHLTYVMRENNYLTSGIAMYGRVSSLQDELPRPDLLSGALAFLGEGSNRVFLAIDVGEAPFGMIPSEIRGHQALLIRAPCDDARDCFLEIPRELPFPAIQKVVVDAAITKEGELRAKVRYSLRGDNELMLRVAFHHTPKEKWKDVANLLAISDGFRGQITSVNASDPMATKDPFTVEYVLTQAKFVDWTKKPVRIPALLPQIGLPDPVAIAEPGKPGPQIELGTPLDVQTVMTLRLPTGTSVETPVGTSVARDYATYASKYSSTQNTVVATRHIAFLKREIPVDRSLDYNAFLHAVQSDQIQRLTLVEGNQ